MGKPLTEELLEQAKALQAKGVSLRQIAIQTGVARSTIAYALSGKVKPKFVKLSKEAVDCPIHGRSLGGFCVQCAALSARERNLNLKRARAL